MYGFIQNGNTRREYYQEIGRKATKKAKCLCGKTRIRTQTFSQTISPFNKVTEADGTVRLKTKLEILEEVKLEIEEWKKDLTTTCNKCHKQWCEEQRAKRAKLETPAPITNEPNLK